jgi:hypothetical protein
MSHRLGWQEDWLGRDNEQDEPTFDLVRSKPRSRARGLVWRAPSQIAQLRSEAGTATDAPYASRPRLSDPEVEPLPSEFTKHRSRRRRAVQVLGGVLLAGSIWAGFDLISSSPKARGEALSWVTLGHPQAADRVFRNAEATVRRLLGR